MRKGFFIGLVSEPDKEQKLPSRANLNLDVTEKALVFQEQFTDFSVWFVIETFIDIQFVAIEILSGFYADDLQIRLRGMERHQLLIFCSTATSDASENLIICSSFHVKISFISG